MLFPVESLPSAILQQQWIQKIRLFLGKIKVPSELQTTELCEASPTCPGHYGLLEMPVPLAWGTSIDLYPASI